MCKIDIALSLSESNELTKNYGCILDYASTVCGSLSLVVRTSLMLSASGYLVLEKLNPFLVEISEVNKWPGTILLGGTASLYKFAYNRESGTLLKEVASNVFDWIQPDFPEDLCLYRPDGSVWLTTISHERDAYLSVTSIETEEIKLICPDLYSRMLV